MARRERIWLGGSEYGSAGASPSRRLALPALRFRRGLWSSVLIRGIEAACAGGGQSSHAFDHADAEQGETEAEGARGQVAEA